jgi:succinoglycan biosynthesis protein ExoL
MAIAYFVHDVADPAVARRVAMLKAGGAEVVLLGFCRGGEAPATVAGTPPVVLGTTRDGALLRRAVSVVGARFGRAGQAAQVRDCEAILARNLETLPLANAVRGRRRLAYEVLDVHHLLLGTGGTARLLRAVEGRLARRADLLVTSSPAFVRAYFGPVSAVRLPLHLAENKLLAADTPPRRQPPRPGPPWRIGLFGALRCRRSFQILAGLARTAGGAVEIVVRGRPSPAVFADLPAEAAAAPHVTFDGPYRNPADLAAIYDDVHFVFAADYFQAGGNSEWLLPNRLYEAGATGTPPIAREGTETANVLRAEEFGVVLPEPLGPQLAAWFSALTPARYEAEFAAAAAVPCERWVAGRAEAECLVSAITGPATSADGIAA